MIYILPANIIFILIIFSLIKRYYEKMTKEKFQKLYPEILLSPEIKEIKIIEHTYKWQPFRSEFKISKHDNRFSYMLGQESINGLNPDMPENEQFEILKRNLCKEFVYLLFKGNLIRIEKNEKLSNRNSDHFECELIIARPPENTTSKLIS